jgi:diguanylate cyclase (GGDEF)-like protein/PAS domain S-box-containing protein
MHANVRTADTMSVMVNRSSRASSGSEQRRRLFDALDDGVVLQDSERTVREWNAAALRMLGLSADQLTGRAALPAGWHVTWENQRVLQGGDPVGTALQRALARGKATIAVRRDGAAPTWIAISSRRVTGDEHGSETIVSTLTDVTARHAVEVQNTHYREIIDTLDASYRILEESPIAMCSVDADGTVLRNNMAFLALGGAEATSIGDLVGADDRATLRQAFGRLVGGRTASVHLEMRIRRPSAVATWCEITAVAMRQGAPDAAVLLLITDITERRRRETRLRLLAERDPLTGLHNRRSFIRVLRSRLAAIEHGPARRNDADWTLMLVDLDGFKDVNDTCGHPGGDAVLVAVAAAIRDRTRVDDIVGRLGGDEFAVLLQASASDAPAIGADIIARITLGAASVEGAPRVTASVGIARLRGGRDAEATLLAADQAMYAAKRAGKARCADADAEEPQSRS